MYEVLKEIEVILRTQLIYCFSKKSLFFYKDVNFFNILGKKYDKKKKLYLKKMEDSVENDSNVHISYYIEQHDNNELDYKFSNCFCDYKEVKFPCKACNIEIKKNKNLENLKEYHVVVILPHG